MTIGLIGYGRFGRFLARHLARTAFLRVYDAHPSSLPGSRGRIRRATLAEAASQEIVILAVPVSSLRRVLRAIRPLLRPGALVLDVCAAKVKPSRWMLEILPAGVQLLGTHPLFGPTGAGTSLKGKSIVLCPLRIPRRRLGRIRQVLRTKGLRPVVMTPEAHDLLVAETIFLTQYTGRLIGILPIGVWDGVTENYASLRRMVDTAERDAWQMFADMVRFNPHARAFMRALEVSHRELASRLAAARAEED